MSDLYFNIRFGTYHFQVHRNKPYVTFNQNEAQVKCKEENPLHWKRFAVYHWFGKYVG
jgi:hypothetical protein